MAKSKLILWLTAEMNPNIKRKADLLRKHDYQSQFVHSLGQLKNNLSQRRVPIIILNEGQDYEQMKEFILGMAKITEARGSRWVFALSKQHPTLIEIAACTNFRDFIPTNIPDSLWLYRVLYASSSQALDFPIPSTHISLDHPAVFSYPCRVIWINQENIRIECQMSPQIGSEIEVNGELFEMLGFPSINLKVEKLVQNRLSFRFSSAIEGKWGQGNKDKVNLKNTLDKINVFSRNPKRRIFLAVKNSETRKQILDFFPADKFDLNAALQIKSLILEPLYYTPDLIFIEDILCIGAHKGRFQRMLSHVGKEIPIIIIGTHPEVVHQKTAYSDYKIIQILKLNFDSLSDTCEKYLPPLDNLEDMIKETYYFETDESLSCATANCKGRLMTVHPLAAYLSSPFPLKNFSIFKISSPFLNKWVNKEPWFKITKNSGLFPSQDKKMNFSGVGYFIDVNSQDKTQFSQGLSAFISKVLGIPQPGLTKGPQETQGSQEKPEMNSAEKLEEGLPTISPVPNYSHSSQDLMLTAAKEDAIPEKPMQPSHELSFINKIFSSSSKNAWYLLLLALASSILIFIISHLGPKLAKNYKRSGAQYTDQLKKYIGE